VRDKRIATFTAGFSGFPGEKYPNLFLFYAFTAPGHANLEVEQAFDQEIERLKEELVSPQELAGVRQRARANLLRSLEDNTGLAMALANWQVLTGDWRELFKQPERISRVTPEDIQRVARTIFKTDNRTTGTLEPLAQAAGN
jgi:predicted Zn-dependent peptidase